MPRRKPTLGYPSLTDAVVALRAEGLTQAQVAARIGIRPANVSALECQARRCRDRSERIVAFRAVLLDRLLPHARQRGISTHEMARQIVETVIEADIVDAVMDDL